MTDDTSAALGRIKAALDYKHRHVQLTEAQAREVLAHIAALEARAERAEAERERLASINADLCRSHNALNIDGAKWQARAEAAEAREAGLREALEEIADERHFRSGHDQSDVGIEPALNATEAQQVARQALAAAPAAPDHPEKTCGDCGRANPVWFASSELWNTVIGGPDGIICPMCFIARAEQNGVVPSAWVVQPDAPAAPEKPGEDLRAIKKALSLAVTMLARNEPGDSRAVSNEFVAIAAVHTGDTSEPVMRVIDAALGESHD